MPALSSAALDADLRFAAGRGPIVPRFALLTQPATDAVAGVAVRMTWAHPDLGPLGPRDVLPRAVRLGLAADLDRWIVEQTCDALARWGGEALDALSLVVVPCAQATSRDPGVVPLARAAADLAGLPADRLILTWPARALSDPLIAAHRTLGVGLGTTGPPHEHADAVVLGPASTRRLRTEPDRQTAIRAAARRGIQVVARPGAPVDALAEVGVTLVEHERALTAADTLAALSGSAVRPAEG